MMEQSHWALESAILAERDAEIEVLRARINFRDALLDELQLEIELHDEICPLK